MQVAITGASGFVGSWLLKSLSKEFDFKPLSIQDLADEANLKRGLDQTPILVHLAGVSSVSECEANIHETYRVNVGLPCYLAEAFYRQNPKGHFVFTSTGQVYTSSDQPQNEASPIAPGNVYARSKLCAEVALSELARQFHGRLTILRLYNHTHRTQNARFVLPSILHQIESSVSDCVQLKVGNIEIERDFSAVQDLVSAFQKLLTSQPADQAIETFNLASGVGKNLRCLITALAQRLGKKVEFEVEPSRLRPNEAKQVIGDSLKFQNRFGWRPKSQSVEAFLDLFLEQQ